MNLASVASATQQPKAKKSYTKPKRPTGDLAADLLGAQPLQQAQPPAQPPAGEPERQFFGAVAQGTPALARGFSPEVKEQVAQDAGSLPEEARRGLIDRGQGVPDYVLKNILQRSAKSSVPAYLQNPANWPEEFKKNLLDPESDDAKMAAYEQDKYGMPTFGYVTDPERDDLAKRLRLTREPGNVYSEAKSMDEHLGNAGVDLPPDVRHAAVGYMWLKNQMNKDDDPVASGTGYSLANRLSIPDNWESFKQQVDQMKKNRDEITARPELAFLNPDMRGTTETMRRQHDPTTVEGAMALWDLAHGGKLTFGHNASPERNAYLEEVKSRIQPDGKLPPGVATGLAGRESNESGVGMQELNRRAETMGLPGTRPTDGKPFLEEGQQDWMQRSPSGGVMPVPHQKGNLLTGTAHAAGQLAAWSLQMASYIGLNPAYNAESQLRGQGPPLTQLPAEFEKNYQGSVTGTVGEIGAQVSPYLIPGFGHAAFVTGLLQQTIDEGPVGFWKGTGVPDAIEVYKNPQSTWQERTHAAATLAMTGLMVWHGAKRLGGPRVAPVDIPVDQVHQEWTQMPPDVLEQAIRIRGEIADGLRKAGATDPRKIEDHATVGATVVARIAQNHGEDPSGLLSRVKYTFSDGLTVPPEIESELGKVSAKVGPMTRAEVFTQAHPMDPRLDPFHDSYDEAFDRRVQEGLGVSPEGFEEGQSAQLLRHEQERLLQKASIAPEKMTDEERDMLEEIGKPSVSLRGEPLEKESVIPYNRRKDGKWRSNLMHGETGLKWASDFSEYQRAEIEEFAQSHPMNDNTVLVPHRSHVAYMKEGSRSSSPEGALRPNEFVSREGPLDPHNRYPVAILRDYAKRLRREIKARQKVGDGLQEVADELGVTREHADRILSRFLADEPTGDVHATPEGAHGSEPSASGTRGTGGQIIARLTVPGFKETVLAHGARELGNDLYAVPDTPAGHMLLDQAGMERDAALTKRYANRNLDQEGLFGEPATSATVATPPEPGQDALFSGLKEGETYSVNAMHTWNPELRTGLIQLGPGATIAEVAHETAHYIRRILPDETLGKVQKALGIAGYTKGWDMAAEERFARAFELYLTEKGSNPGLDPIMARLAIAVRDTYSGAKQEGGVRSYVKKQIGRNPTPEDILKFHAEPTVGEGELKVPDALKGVFDDMTKRPESWPGMTAAVAAKEKEDANLEQQGSDGIGTEVPGSVPEEGTGNLGPVVPETPEPPDIADTGQTVTKPERKQYTKPKESKAPVQQAEVESPFGEDAPREAVLTPNEAKAKTHFEGKGMPPDLAEKAARGVYGDDNARRALVGDQEALDALGKAFGKPDGIAPGLAHSLLDRIGEMTAQREGFKWKSPHAPEETAPSGTRGFQTKMKSEDVVERKMNGPMDTDAFFAMLRNNGVKAAEIEALDKFRPDSKRLSPDQAREWIAKTKENVYGEHTFGTDFEKFMSDADKVERDNLREAARALEPAMDDQGKRLSTLRKNMIAAVKQYVKNRGIDKVHDEMRRLRAEAYKVLVKHDDLGFDDTNQAYSALWSHYNARGNFENWDIPPSDAKAIQDSVKFNSDHHVEDSLYRASTGEMGFEFYTKDLFPLSHAEIEGAKAAREKTVKRYSAYSEAAHTISDQYTPKWPSYVVKPAGDNYREVVVRAPGYGDATSHFSDIPDYDSHIRMSDRTVDGKPTTFIEELQSDRHQNARKYGGYVTPEEQRAIVDRYDQSAKALSDAEQSYDEFLDTPGWSKDPQLRNEHARLQDARIEARLAKAEAWNALSHLEDRPMATPFYKNWEDLAFRRTLLDAAMSGHEQVAWTAGDVHAERYKERPNEDWLDQDGEVPRDTGPADRNAKRARGFQAAYDERLVNIANDIGKKYGVRAEKTTVEGKPAWKMEIPPEMAKDVKDNGLTLFSGERRLPGIQGEELDKDIADVLTPEDQASPGWRGPLAKLKKFKGNLATAGASAAGSFVMNELPRYGEAGKRATAKIVDAWAFGRHRSAELRDDLGTAMADVYAPGTEGFQNLAFRALTLNAHDVEIRDTARAVMTRWDSKQRLKVLGLDDAAFEDWANTAKDSDIKGSAKGDTGPTVRQVRLWREWGKIATTLGKESWSQGIGPWRTVGPDMADYEGKLRGKEVQYVVGGHGKDAPGLLENGTFIGWDDAKNVALVMSEHGEIRSLKPGDVVTTPSLIDGMEYFPRKLLDDVAQSLSDPSSPMYREEIARRMKSGMTTEQAQASLSAQLEGVKVQVPGRGMTRIEYPRLPGTFPPEYYDWDFKRVTGRHIDSVTERTAQAQALGAHMEDLAADLAEASGGNHRLVTDWADSIQGAFGRGQMNDPSSKTARDAFATYGAAKALLELGTGKTTIKQIGSIANTAAITGWLPTLRSLPSMLTPSAWREAHRAGILQEDFAKLRGIDFAGNAKEAATTFLNVVGVTPADKGLRVGAADAGVMATKIHVMRLARLPEGKWDGTRSYSFLSDWAKFSDEQIGKMVQRAHANGGRFDFTMDGMAPLYTKAQFAGARTQGITDPINFPKAVNKYPVFRGMLTLNTFNYLQSNVVGYSLNRLAKGDPSAVFTLIATGTMIGNVVAKAVSELDKHKQIPFWHAYFKSQGQSDEDAKRNALNAADARAERPGFHYATDIDWHDWASGGTQRQIWESAASGLSISGALGMYDSALDAVKPEEGPMAKSAYDRATDAASRVLPLPSSDSLAPFAAVGAAMSEQKRQKDKELLGGEPGTKPPANIGKDIATAIGQAAVPPPLIGRAAYRKPVAWKLAMGALSDENAKLARRYGAYPQPKMWKGEDTELFLARVRRQAENWGAMIDNARAQKLTGDALREAVLKSSREAFRKTYSQ